MTKGDAARELRVAEAGNCKPSTGEYDAALALAPESTDLLESANLGASPDR